jgi:hypothetical protein
VKDSSCRSELKLPQQDSRTARICGKENMLGTILIVVLILMLIGALPTWPHSRNWGYYPSGGLGMIVLILVVLLLLGQI